MGVNHAFGFAGAAAGVENEQRIFGVHGFGGDEVGQIGIRHGFVPPDFAAAVQLGVQTGPVRIARTVCTSGQPYQGLIHVPFKGTGLPARNPPSTVMTIWRRSR